MCGVTALDVLIRLVLGMSLSALLVATPILIFQGML
jgi:hypothetical protein